MIITYIINKLPLKRLKLIVNPLYAALPSLLNIRSMLPVSDMILGGKLFPEYIPT